MSTREGGTSKAMGIAVFRAGSEECIEMRRKQNLLVATGDSSSWRQAGPCAKRSV